jgi:hypothetical protein
MLLPGARILTTTSKKRVSSMRQRSIRDQWHRQRLGTALLTRVAPATSLSFVGME